MNNGGLLKAAIIKNYVNTETMWKGFLVAIILLRIITWIYSYLIFMELFREFQLCLAPQSVILLFWFTFTSVVPSFSGAGDTCCQLKILHEPTLL